MSEGGAFLHIPGNEWRRKLLHMSSFALAFLLPLFTPAQAVLGVLAAFTFNAFLLPALCPRIFRPDGQGRLTGALEIALYPAAILATILAFSGQASYGEPVLRVWFALAIGDGLLGVSHRVLAFGPRLPWNGRKTWPGLGLGSLLFSAAAAGSLALSGFGPLSNGLGFLLAGVWVLAVVESLWFGIADNLTLPFTATLLLWGTTKVLPEWPLIASVLVFALGAWLLKKTTLGGALLGFVIALVLVTANPWLFAFLLGFGFLGVVATRFRFTEKAARGIEDRGRGTAEVFGALSLAAWLAPLAQGSRAGLLVLLAPLIAKTFDTVSSEMGKAFQGTTVALYPFRRVAPGTDGAVSLAGTLWGAAGATLLAGLILPLHWGGPKDVALLVAIACAANLFESAWSLYAAPRGMNDGPHTNVLMTLCAAVLAWFTWFKPALF